MKFWLASANVEKAEEYLAFGVFEGLITNPDVVAREKQPPKKLFNSLCEFAPRVYYQLQDMDIEDMIQEAEEMISINPDKMLIKVPATRNGLSVIRHLTDHGQQVMATAVPTAPWMVFAIAAGAKKIAPYSSMLKRRHIMSKMEGVFAMQDIIDRQEYDVEICTGIYHVTEIPRYASHGIKSAFIWEKDVEEYLTLELADEAAANFHPSWAKIRKQG